MVKAAGVVALLLVALDAHAITLNARVDKTDVVLGGSVALEITGTAPGAARPLDAFSLDELSADFEVLDVSVGTRGAAGRTTQSLTAQLYPRRPGRARIPAWRVGDARSAPIDITVRESGPDRRRVIVRAGVTPERPHVRAGAVLYLDICDPNDFSWMPAEPVPGAGVHLRPLAESRRADTIDGEQCSVLRYSWAVTALRDGAIRIAFESLRARKFGQRLRFSVPESGFTALPVPAWLPVYVPVGAPEIRMDPPPAEMQVDRPVNWQFTVTGSGLSVNGLKQLLAGTLGESRGVRWYAPSVELVDEPQPRTPAQTFRVTIPVLATEHGAIELPALVLPYFDPERERLDTLSIAGPRTFAISPVRQTAWRVGSAVVALLFVAGMGRIVAAALRRARRRREMLARIERASTPREIKAALLDASAPDKASPGSTLRRWLRNANADDEVAAWVERLEGACYAQRPADAAALKRGARRAVYASRE